MSNSLWDRIEQVPDSDRYPGLAQIMDHTRSLASKPGFRVETIGRSQMGRDIDLITFGNGSRPRVLLSGFEDPHEPICSLSMMWLCAELSNARSPIHELGYDWAMVPCLNPDGVTRNEHWFAHPGDLRAFLNGAYEDEIEYWGEPQYPEEHALAEAIARTKPERLFGMHDESHFPGHGYWALVSDEAMLQGLEGHFDYESRIGVEPVAAPVGPEVMRKNWYNAKALGLNSRCVSMICEPRGYRRLAPPRDAEENGRQRYMAALDQYESLLEALVPSTGEERALMQCAVSSRQRMRNEQLFSICTGACGLRVLIAHGKQQEAESIESALWDYLVARLKGTYTPIPIRNQVRIQLHFLFSVLGMQPTVPAH